MEHRLEITARVKDLRGFEFNRLYDALHAEGVVLESICSQSYSAPESTPLQERIPVVSSRVALIGDSDVPASAPVRDEDGNIVF